MINCRLYDVFHCTRGLGTVTLLHILVGLVTLIFSEINNHEVLCVCFFKENVGVVLSVRPRQPCCVLMY